MKQSRGRKRHAGEGNRLTRSQIALRSGIGRETVSEYMARDGAPKPDETMRYDYDEALAWIKSVAPKAGQQQSPAMASMREELLRIQLETERIELAVLRNKYIDKALIEPAVAMIQTQWLGTLQSILEGEIPRRMEGLTMAQRAELMAGTVDRLMKWWKEALGKLAAQKPVE